MALQSLPFHLIILLCLLLSSVKSEDNEDGIQSERKPYFRRKDFIRHHYGLKKTNQEEPSKIKRHKLQTQFFNMKDDYRSTSSSVQTTPRYKIPVLIKKLAKRPRKQNLCAQSNLLECATNENSTSTIHNTYGGIETVFSLLREDVWVIPLLIGDVSLIIVLVVFEVFLLSKVIRSNPSRRHLFLGQVLMIGLFLCAGISVCHVLKPTEISCSVTRLGTGISYSIVFSTLLVKLVFLISLNSGVYLPGTYQCLLLCFAILIQVVIGVQWILSSPPKAENGQCDLEFPPFLFSLLYVFFLMGVVSLLSFKARGIRENYREASYISLVMVFSSCIFVIWIIGGFIAPLEYQPVGIGGGLLAVASITFVIMFMPKGRQLSAIGKEGVYSEDRSGNRLYSGSSLQSTGSGTPSPSFFPIKPGKLNFRERLATPPTPKKTRHGVISETRRDARSSHCNSSRHPVFSRASKQQQNRHHHASSSLLRERSDSKTTEDSYLSGLDIFTYLRNEQNKNTNNNHDHLTPNGAFGLNGNSLLLLNNQMVKREEEYLSTIPRRNISEAQQQRYSRTNPNVTFRRSSEMNNGSGLLY